MDYPICEWNPTLKQKASNPRLGTDCRAVATEFLGHGKKGWRLCEICSKLPRFSKFKLYGGGRGKLIYRTYDMVTGAQLGEYIPGQFA